MKKSIFALLFLLLLLIVTCVYQKTYTLYAVHTSEEETLNLEKPAEVISLKEEHTPAKEQHMAVTKTEIIVAPAIKKTSSKEPTLLEKIKTTVVSVVSPEKEVPQTKTVSKKVEATHEQTPTIHLKAQPTLDTKAEEKEVVDYLLTVLEERNVALSNRDEAENRLQALIKKALENRRIAIENMDRASTQIEMSHQKRLETRETNSQNNTEEKGK